MSLREMNWVLSPEIQQHKTDRADNIKIYQPNKTSSLFKTREAGYVVAYICSPRYQLKASMDNVVKP